MASPLHFPAAVPALSFGTVTLRELTEADIPAWFERATDREAADLAGDAVPTSIDQGAAWLQRHRDRLRQQTALRWAIVPVGCNGSVGTIGLSWSGPSPGVADQGIVIGRAHWGQGIGSSALQAVVRHAFGALGLAAIQAEVLQRNRASIRLLEKAGFRRLRATTADPPASSPHDDGFLYGLAAADWGAA